MPNNINTLILSALKDKSLYGLEIIKSIQNDTNGKLVLKQPSLYSSLRRLETQNFVSSYWTDSDLGGKRHYYNITPTGLQYLKKKLSVNEAEENFLSDTVEKLSDKNEIEKDEKTIKQYSPVKHSGSFSDVMREYVPPKNKYPEYELEDKKQTIKKDENIKKIEPQNNIEIIFPDIDDDLDFDDLLDEDEVEKVTTPQKELSENKVSNDINYKDILGDLYLDEETVLPTTSSTPNKESKNIKTNIDNDNELKILNKSREYAKEFASILTSTDTDKNPFEPKATLVNPNSIKLLEDISKRHKEKMAPSSPVENQSIDENIIENAENKSQIISAQNKIERKPPTVSTENTKYILINKLKIISQLILSTIMILEVVILFIIYLTQNWLSLEQYILFGSALAIISAILLTRYVHYKKYPDKKIRKKVKWGSDLLYRIIATLLLIVVTISINLLMGMNEFFRYDYLLRWLLPSLLLLNISTAWIVNILLAHKVKYQI